MAALTFGVLVGGDPLDDNLTALMCCATAFQIVIHGPWEHDTPLANWLPTLTGTALVNGLLATVVLATLVPDAWLWLYSAMCVGIGLPVYALMVVLHAAVAHWAGAEALPGQTKARRWATE